MARTARAQGEGRGWSDLEVLEAAEAAREVPHGDLVAVWKVVTTAGLARLLPRQPPPPLCRHGGDLVGAEWRPRLEDLVPRRALLAAINAVSTEPPLTSAA